MRQYKVFVILIQVILFQQPLSAGFERNGQPSALLAQSGSGVAHRSVENLWLNPASLIFSGGFHGSLFYTPSPFGMEQLANYGMIVSHSSASFSGAAGLQSFGFALYKETTSSFAGAFRLSDETAAGMSVHVCHLSIERYGNAVRTLVDLGFLYSVTENISFGTAVHNVGGASFGEGDDIPRKILTGFSVNITNSVSLTADLVKDIRYPVSYSWSVQFLPLEQFALQIGWDGATSSVSGGVGLRLSSLQIQYGGVSHPVLGLTHSVGVSF